MRAQIRLLSGLAPDRVIFPLFAAQLVTLLIETDFSVFLAGLTGTFKTELASLIQQHFGAGLDARHLPANWSSTPNSLEALAFAAKDAVLVVDDFCPTGTSNDQARLHSGADRLMRAQGNRSGRGRLRPDGTAQPVRPPRGLILSTGEDIPRGHSLAARMLIVEVAPGDVDAAYLTTCQRDAAAGRYAAATAGYIRWLAGQLEETRREFRMDALKRRVELARTWAPGRHRRAPGMVADLLAAFDRFLWFALDFEAIDGEEYNDLTRRCREALGEAADRQATYHEVADPCLRYLQLLGAALASGRCHLASPEGGRPDTSASTWGWREGEDLGSGRPQGNRIGWVADEDVYLEPEAAYAQAQRLATEQGEGLALSRDTLHRRLGERGLLASTDPARGKLVIRKMLAGGRRYVLHVAADRILGGCGGGPNGPIGPRLARG